MYIYNGISTLFKMSYPPTSAYEFEYLKSEEDVQNIWKQSTIYMLCQKKVYYFGDLTASDSVFEGYICQRENSNKLKFRFDLSNNDKLFPTEGCYNVNIQFFYEEKELQQPYKEVAGIKIHNEKNEFLSWLNPERLVYEYLTGKIQMEIHGDIGSFLKYHIHYIGQSQDQWIWDRLTGHEKLSKILATVFPLFKGEFNAYEHTILLFHLGEYQEKIMMFPNNNFGFTSDCVKKLSKAKISSIGDMLDKSDIDNKIVNDFEAYLINLFEPKYNKIKFKNYPKMKNGLKSIGYTAIEHQFMTYFSLSTNECQHSIKITPIYGKQPSNR